VQLPRSLPHVGASAPIGVAAGVALVGLTVVLLLPFREDLSQAAPALVLVIPVVVAGVAGGTRAAVATGVVATLAMNLAFVPPYGNADVAVVEDVIALGVFLVVAVSVGALVAIEADRLAVAQRRAEDLETLNRELADVSRDRARLAEEANRIHVLEQVDAQRAALLRSVSHDLRTPLATIRAVTTDLQDEPDYDQATRQELLGLVGDEAERLDRLVANLLSLSRIEAGSFAPERQAVDLEELVRERVRRLSSMFSQVRLVVDIDDDLPLVDGDYTQLEQVLTNLLENAARHAPPASTLTISAHGARDGQNVELLVIDEGIGVAEHERSRVFDAFRRGEGSRSSGIGLAICKAVVEAHGGSITVRRTEGGGATFVVLLPARRDQVGGRR
jgi:two-component system sensor histidine kinase KdpD